MPTFIKEGDTLRPVSDTLLSKTSYIPYVENINVDELGTITWQKPNVNKFSQYDYKLYYEININGNTFTSDNEEFLGYPYLLNGDNYIIIKVKLDLKQKDGKIHTHSFVKTN